MDAGGSRYTGIDRARHADRGGAASGPPPDRMSGASAAHRNRYSGAQRGERHCAHYRQCSGGNRPRLRHRNRCHCGQLHGFNRCRRQTRGGAYARPERRYAARQRPRAALCLHCPARRRLRRLYCDRCRHPGGSGRHSRDAATHRRRRRCRPVPLYRGEQGGRHPHPPDECRIARLQRDAAARPRPVRHFLRYSRQRLCFTARNPRGCPL